MNRSDKINVIYCYIKVNLFRFIQIPIATDPLCLVRRDGRDASSVDPGSLSIRSVGRWRKAPPPSRGGRQTWGDPRAPGSPSARNGGPDRGRRPRRGSGRMRSSPRTPGSRSPWMAGRKRHADFREAAPRSGGVACGGAGGQLRADAGMRAAWHARSGGSCTGRRGSEALPGAGGRAGQCTTGPEPAGAHRYQ